LWLNVFGLKRSFKPPAIDEYDLEITQHLHGSPPMARHVNYLNPAGLCVVVSGRIDPLTPLQLEGVIAQNFELNCFLQPMPSIVGYFENVLIGESAHRMENPDGIARERAES
jgi:hypothetical protein